MPDIEHEFPINAPIERVFTAVSTPAGLESWWTLKSAGKPALGAHYDLDFGPGYVWGATITKCDAPREIEFTMDDHDPDWRGTKVGVKLTPRDGGGTLVNFSHRGWPGANTHYRVSNCCWAMYLRILRRNIEHGETVPYEKRLDV